jgi:3-oxoacid CoA-transferase B subunit
MEVILQSENGLLGIGPFPTKDAVNADLINAGKQTVTYMPGAAFFDSAASFAMIRGGHIDLTVLGAFEVSEKGDIASWKVPGKLVKGMGGAMDLVAAAKNIIAACMHTDKDGNSKLLKQCTLPLTGVNCVKRVVTDLAVVDITPQGFKLIERAPGISVEQIKNATEGALIIEGEIPEMNIQ